RLSVPSRTDRQTSGGVSELAFEEFIFEDFTMQYEEGERATLLPSMSECTRHYVGNRLLPVGDRCHIGGILAACFGHEAQVGSQFFEESRSACCASQDDGARPSIRDERRGVFVTTRYKCECRFGDAGLMAEPGRDMSDE